VNEPEPAPIAASSFKAPRRRSQLVQARSWPDAHLLL